MADFAPGDLVVLKSGSMRMLVESVEGETVSLIWANEGVIGRDAVPAFALSKWEYREPREPRPEGDRPPRAAGAGKPYGGERKGGAKPYAGKDDRPPPKPRTGMDGKPKQKTYYRKDG